jgi:hypothetical protein
LIKVSIHTLSITLILCCERSAAMVRADRYSEDWTVRETLQRLVALLFSLANLADIASTRSFRVRCEVLAIIRRGEAAAFRSVAGAAGNFGAPVPAQAIVAAGDWMMADDGNDPTDAVRLAQRLRALAFALAFLLWNGEAPGAPIIGFRDVLPASTLVWPQWPVLSTLVPLPRPP